MMAEHDMKSEAKKEGLMALIKKMYEMMADEHEASEEGEEMPSMAAHESGSEGDLMKKAMEVAEEAPKAMEGGSDLDMEEIKEFLTKRRKPPVGKALNIMAITKVAPKKFDAPKMKKYT